MRQLFAVMPFGMKEGTRGPFDFDLVYRGAIQPAAEAAGWQVTRADEIVSPGLITEQVLREIVAADLLVADISGENGNVFYELGVRQALSAGGTVLIAQADSRLPFDVAHQRVLMYDPTDAGIDGLRGLLIEALVGYQGSGDTRSNPVSNLLARQSLTTDPGLDAGAFEVDLNGRVSRATTLEQLVGVWSWARTRSPLPATPLTALAYRLSEVGEWATAVDVLSAAVIAAPDDYEAHRQLGWCLRQLGADHFPLSERAFLRALELNPSDPETLGMLGGLYKREKRYLEAADCYRDASRVAPTAWNSRVNQAAVEILASPTAPAGGVARYASLLAFVDASSVHATDNEWTEIVRAEANFAAGDDVAAAKHYDRGADLASSLGSLEGAASQLQLFAEAGFRSAAARDLYSRLRRRIDGRREVTAREPSPTEGEEDGLPVIIHLSDLHFDKGSANGVHRFDGDPSGRTLADHVAEDILRGPWDFQPSRLHLVVSGDLVWQGLEEEFARAEHALAEIAERLHIPRERVYIVPGNHDINWSLGKAEKGRRFDNFLRFLVRFYGEELAGLRYPNIGMKLSDGAPAAEDIATVVFDHDARLVIACLNSCVYEAEGHNYGYVGEAQLKAMRDAVLGDDRASDYVKVAVVHHHLHPFPEYLTLPSGDGEIWSDLSTIRDGAIVEQMLSKLGFSIVLHGHKHRAQTRETLVREVSAHSEDAASLIVCGAGSVSCLKLAHSVPNQYEVLELHQIPRRSGAEFTRLTWRTLDLAAGADWITTKSWDIKG